MRAIPVSETLLTHLQKKEAGLKKMAGPGVRAVGGGELMAPEVGAAWALEDIMTYNVLPCFQVGLELPWVLMRVRGAEVDIVFPVMEGPGTLDEKMVPEP